MAHAVGSGTAIRLTYEPLGSGADTFTPALVDE
jgi:hypothetical protein